MKVLVTGAAGYVGSEVVRRALAAGHDVVAAYLEREPDAGEPLRLDVRDADAVAHALARARPDAVVHTAYRLEGDAMWETNVDGAANVARAAADARLVHMSTDLVFDGDLAPPARYTETDATTPRYPYGRAKAEAERQVAAAHPGAVLVRTSLVYGGATPSPYEQRALAAARGELEMGFYTNELRCPVLVADLADAILELVQRREIHGPLHVAGPDVVSRHGFARLIAVHHGLGAGSIAPALSTDPTRPKNCALDCSRAAELLSVRPRGVGEALPPR